jgi:hypothetical protein
MAEVGKNKYNKRSHLEGFYLKRSFAKKNIWIILLLHFIIVGFLFFIIRRSSVQEPKDLVDSKEGG